MLASIEIWLNTDFFKVKDDLSYSNLIFTGSIDEFFRCKFGKLQYRSLRFIYENHDQEFYQDWVQINYPNDYNFTRIVEIKHATGQKTKKTTIVKEFPADSGDPFYSIPFYKNIELYLQYKKKAKKLRKHFL